MQNTQRRRIIEFIKYDPKLFIEYLEQIGGCEGTEFIDQTLEDFTTYYLVDGEFEEWAKDD